MIPSTVYPPLAGRGRPVLSGRRIAAAMLALVTLFAAPLLLADRDGEDGARPPAFEPPGVPAGKPYQVRGTIERLDVAGDRIVVDGTTYRYTSPHVHRPPGAPGKEDQRYETARLRPGMSVGLRVGRGDPRPVLEVWILR